MFLHPLHTPLDPVQCCELFSLNTKIFKRWQDNTAGYYPLPPVPISQHFFHPLPSVISCMKSKKSRDKFAPPTFHHFQTGRHIAALTRGLWLGSSWEWSKHPRNRDILWDPAWRGQQLPSPGLLTSRNLGLHSEHGIGPPLLRCRFSP